MQNEESEIRKIKPVQYASNQQFYAQMKSIQYINNPLVDLANVPSAIVLLWNSMLQFEMLCPVNMSFMCLWYLR